MHTTLYLLCPQNLRSPLNIMWQCSISDHCCLMWSCIRACHRWSKLVCYLWSPSTDYRAAALYYLPRPCPSGPPAPPTHTRPWRTKIGDGTAWFTVTPSHTNNSWIKECSSKLLNSQSNIYLYIYVSIYVSIMTKKTFQKYIETLHDMSLTLDN